MALIVRGIGLAVLLASCATPARSLDPVTPPPPGPSPRLATLAFADPDVPAPAGGDRLEAVAASELGFVAVGVHDRHGLDDALIWFSDDGLSWQPVGDEQLLEGGSLIDVAAGADGFVAVGTDRVRDVEPDGLILTSPDGRHWRRAEAPLAFAYVLWVATGGHGWLAGGAEADSDPDGLVWQSGDGDSWGRQLVPDLLGPNAGVEMAPDGDGWVAYGAKGDDGPLAALWSSPDLRSWTREPVELQAGDGIARAIIAFAATARARLAVGQFSFGSCGAGASCPGEVRAWRSGAGEGWRVLPRDAWPFGGDLAVTASGDDLVIAHSGGIAASTDGWHWLELGQPDAAGGEIRDVAVRDGVVVVVGERSAGADVFPYLAAASP